METVTTVTDLCAVLAASRATDRIVGFVPTMGYLHAGHASLVERAEAECETVVASVFVNPLQFAAGEDLATYPRDPDGHRTGSDGSTLDLPILCPAGWSDCTNFVEPMTRPWLVRASVASLMV